MTLESYFYLLVIQTVLSSTFVTFGISNRNNIITHKMSIIILTILLPTEEEDHLREKITYPKMQRGSTTWSRLRETVEESRAKAVVLAIF